MESEEGFSYDGYLVFNEILSIEEPIDQKQIIDRLPRLTM